MDRISTLIENNLNQAIILNNILKNNDIQLNNISKEQNELETKNSLITQVLNSWSCWWEKVWYINSYLEKPDLVDNKLNLLDEENKKILIKSQQPKLILLSEMANLVSKNLDIQNEMLENINKKNISLEYNLKTNQNKIDNIMHS